MTGELITKREIGDDAVLFEFEMPADFTFEAGQYIQLILPNGLKHYFSVASSPAKLPILDIATRMSGSEYKNFLKDVPLGAGLEFKGPWGDLGEPFTKQDKNVRSYIFVAGGIGITMFRSVIKWAQEKKLTQHFQLLYFNRDRKSTVFFEELRQLPENFKIDFIMSDDPDWSGEKGRMSEELIKKLVVDLSVPVFYIIGPPGFVNAGVTMLKNLGITEDRIIYETYTGYK